jgi:DNA-binding response OmpR family regulator
VLLDMVLPDIPGTEVITRLRERSSLPIIVLSVREAEGDKVRALELGADDYLTKEFNPRELVARVKAVLRRSTAPEQPASRPRREPVVIGNTRIDPDSHEVTIGDRQVELRAKEFDLLLAFVEHLGIVLERDRLLNEVWGYEYFGDTRTVDVHVAHLRDRLTGSSLCINTVRGVGYKMTG